MSPAHFPSIFPGLEELQGRCKSTHHEAPDCLQAPQQDEAHDPRRRRFSSGKTLRNLAGGAVTKRGALAQSRHGFVTPVVVKCSPILSRLSGYFVVLWAHEFFIATSCCADIRAFVGIALERRFARCCRRPAGLRARRPAILLTARRATPSRKVALPPLVASRKGGERSSGAGFCAHDGDTL